MFFKDQSGAQAVLFGENPVAVVNFSNKDENDFLAGVQIGEPIKQKVITRDNNEKKISVRAKIRLVFRDMESVDNIIKALQNVKKTLLDNELKTMIKENQPLKPE